MRAIVNNARGKGSTRRMTLLLAAVCLAAAGFTPCRAQQVQVFASSKAGDRLARKPSLRFEPGKPAASPTFRIDDSVTYQEIDGFGASFLEAGLVCLHSLPPGKQEEVLRALFDPGTGAGFTVMKTVMAATDFMSAGPFYSYDDTPGDTELKHFSIQRDLRPNGLITFIKRARKYGQFRLEAPMDYPPDWMLTTVEDRKHQDVNPRYYGALAQYYLRYLQEYQKHGVFIDYLSLFNEPGIYTKIPYESIRTLYKDHVAPLFQQAGVKTKLCFAEAEDRESAAANYPIVLDDPEARKFVPLLPFHGYRWKSSEPMTSLHKRYPDLKIWQTEVCYSYGSGTPPSMPLPRYDFLDGDFWGNLLVTDLEENSSAWIYWNMISDQTGGPWLVSEEHEDYPANIQHPVVIIDRKKQQVTYSGLYYYLAHFSKFVRPGSVRVDTQGSDEHVRVIAFKTPEGRLVAEVLNSQHVPATVHLAWHDCDLRVDLQPLSITTLQWSAEVK
jgi:glucosylceramidase